MTFHSPQISGTNELMLVKISPHPDPYLPKVYNLGFGPPNGNGGFRDDIRLKHSDSNRVFSTVSFLGLIFLQVNPELILGIDGSDDLRATMYHLSSLTPLGATLVRTDVDYEYDEQSDEEMEEFEEDIANERAKIKSATAEEKSRIQKKIAKLKEKRKDRIAELKEKVKEAASHIKASARDRKVSKIRNNIEKHQKKIAALETKLHEVLSKDQTEKDQKEVAH
jgi:hypothetical protein